MRGKSFKICKIFGIDIEVDLSWLIIFFAFTWVLSEGFLPGVVPRQPVIYYWLFGIATVLLLFTCVLVHELAHSLVGKRCGISFRKITLHLFGGVAQYDEPAKSPKTEFFMAVAGPVASIVLAGIFFVLANVIRTNILLILASLTYLWCINLALAIFNLLPAYPLDGGRILRAALWKREGELKATEIAARSGKFFGFLIIILGIFFVFNGNLMGGVWFVFIGWFLKKQAEIGYQQLLIEKLAGKLKVREVMESLDFDEQNSCSSDDNLNVVFKKMVKSGATGLYVVEDNKVVGMVTLAEIYNKCIDFKK